MKLSYKKVSYVVMMALMTFSGFYYFTVNNDARSRPAYGQGASIGPEYFPNGLAVLLFLLCLFGLFRTYQMEDRKIEVHYAGHILLAAGLTGLFIGGWYALGLFYPFAFLFLAALLYIFRAAPERHLFTATTSILIALAVTGIVYLVFDLVMSLRF